LTKSLSTIARVDRRGRLVIPAKLKKKLKIGSAVRLKEKDGKLELTPIADPLKKLEGSAKVRVTARELDHLAEVILSKEALK